MRQEATNLGANIVEEQLGSSRAADIDTTSELDGLGLIGLAVLEVGELLLEAADIVVDVELESLASRAVCSGTVTTNLVRVGLALGVKLIDGP